MQSLSVKPLLHSTELIPLPSTECHKRYSVEFIVYTRRNRWERTSGRKTHKYFSCIFCFGHPPRQLSFLLEISKRSFRVFQDLYCTCLGYCRIGDTNESHPNYWTFCIVLVASLLCLSTKSSLKPHVYLCWIAVVRYPKNFSFFCSNVVQNWPVVAVVCKR